MPAFGSLQNSQIEHLVKYLRELQGGSSKREVQGDRDRGEVLFFGRAQCSKCHMVNGRGGFLGADLSGYGSSHGASEILQAILDPGKSLDPRHGAVTVTTRGGRKYTGVIRNEDNFSLQMQTEDGLLYLFDKSRVSRVEHWTRSIMPSTFGSLLNRQELDDLVAFLEQDGIVRSAVSGDEDE